MKIYSPNEYLNQIAKERAKQDKLMIVVAILFLLSFIKI